MSLPRYNATSSVCQCRCLNNHPLLDVCHWGSELHEMFGRKICMPCAIAVFDDYRAMVIRDLVDVTKASPTNANEVKGQ